MATVSGQMIEIRIPIRGSEAPTCQTSTWQVRHSYVSASDTQDLDGFPQLVCPPYWVFPEARNAYAARLCVDSAHVQRRSRTLFLKQKPPKPGQALA